MRLHLPDGNTPVEAVSRDILDILERRRVPAPVAMTALIEVLVVAISMAPKEARREITGKLQQALKDNIDFVTRQGL